MHAQQAFRPIITTFKTQRCSYHRPLAASLILALIFSVALSQAPVQAVNYTWTNTSGGNWLIDGNWNNPGAPDDASDTATLGNLSGAYTVTLGSATTIGGLTLSGTDPTVTLNSSLTLTGTSTISGGNINGTGTMIWNNGSTINWTGGSTGGTLTYLVPHEHTVVVNNSSGAFSLASGQKLHIAATGAVGGFPGDIQTATTTFSNGFANSGTIQLGNPSPGDNYGVVRLIATNGTMTNNLGGNINFLPRSTTSSATPWNIREIRANVQNDGTITSYAMEGMLGGAGKTVVNSATGVIRTDHSLYAAGHLPGVIITGDSFSNNGVMQIGVNPVGGEGGYIRINSTTINFNNLSSVTGPGTLELGGATVNVNAGTSISGLTMLTLGRNTIATALNWNIADLTDAMTYRIPGGGNVTWNRSGDWTIQNNQTLWFDGPPSGGDNASHLNMAVNVTNNGLLRMGSQPGTGRYLQANLNLSGSTTFTNSATGVIDMLVRGPAESDTTWNARNINANVINNGTINTYVTSGRLGDSGKTVVNNGAINVNSTQYTNGAKAMLQTIGASFTNNAGGTINVSDGTMWFNTPTVNYDGGSITGVAGGTIRLGSAAVDTNFIFNGGAEITGPITWHVSPLSENTITRSTTWNIANGGGIFLDAPADPGFTGLISNQDISNSGLVRMGRPQPGDNFSNQYLRVDSPNGIFTNNSDGVILMYPRSASSTGDPHSIRRLEAELHNNGQVTTYTHRALIGRSIAGIDHVNNGTMTLHNGILTSTPQPQFDILGDSFLNGPNGVINGNGIFNVVTLNGTADVLQNAGTLSPGLSAGILTVQGNLNFLAGGNILIEIVGDNAVAGVDYDRLIVSGQVTNLSQADLIVDMSSLSLDLEGDVFTIVTSAATDFTGMSFNSVLFTGPGQWKGDVIYGNGFIQLANIQSYVPEPASGWLMLVGLLTLRKRARRCGK